MNIVLLSGGSGKRLWPLSTDTQSKQFLKLLKNERGEYESMVQRVISQIKTVQPDSNVFISCNQAQEDILTQQVRQVELIKEPAKRDTFPAISLAAAYLFYKKQMKHDDVFIICPVDAFADSKYFELLAEVEKLINSGKNEVGLMGVVPAYPSEIYGYIVHKGGQAVEFVEKPAVEKAEKLISGGALWNCGVFAVKIGYILRRAEKYVKFDSFESLFQNYCGLPKISFDYEVVEKESSIGVVTYNGVWKDLGTWDKLTEEMSGNSIGKNILISENCLNTHVINMLDIPVIAQDLNEIVVVASSGGILISSKQGSSLIKPLAERAGC